MEITYMPRSLRDFMNEVAFMIYTLPIVCNNCGDVLDSTVTKWGYAYLYAETLELQILGFPSHLFLEYHRLRVVLLTRMLGFNKWSQAFCKLFRKGLNALFHSLFSLELLRPEFLFLFSVNLLLLPRCFFLFLPLHVAWSGR